MRLEDMFIPLVLLFSGLLGQVQTALAAEREPISVQWFEPKVLPTDVKGLTYVNLVGKTSPNVTVQVNPDSIIVIQPADPKNKELPRIGETLVKSEGRGYFRLKLFMPNGLSQVPISFRKDNGEQNSILLTMRVDKDDASLNVKVTRPTKTKIVKVMEKPPVKFSVGLGLAPLSFSEKLSPTGLADLKLQQTSFQALRLETSIKSIKWWWLLQYEMATFKAPSSLDDRTVKGGNTNLQAALIGGRYRLNNAENELWASVDVDGRFFPLMTVNTSNEVNFVDTKIFRLGLGLSYLIKGEKMDYSTSLFYREPISIKVGSGELTYASKYTASLQAKMNYHLNDNWRIGAGAEAEFTTFNFEYLNSPALTTNKGTGSFNVFQVLANVQYWFGGEKKKDPNSPATP